MQSTDEKDLSSQFFLSALSHEIRQPLNGIVGYNQLLCQTQVTTVQKNYLSSMSKCCIQLLGLLNDIIDYSQLSVGRMKYNKECFAISEITDIVENTLYMRLNEKKHRLQWTISRNLPNYIVSDKQKIIQVLINLISNANKFTNIGGHISIHISPKQNDIIEFTVKDDGIGIPLECQDKLFDVFYQVEHATTKSGSGLGLAISKKIVELLGGHIEVKSIVNKGSTFSFTIKHESKDNESDIKKKLRSMKNKYVLIFDRNPDNRIMLSEMLFECKLRPIVCASHAEVINFVSNKRYNFSLGILSFSESSTMELVSNIQQQEHDLPLIALIDSHKVKTIDRSCFEHVMVRPIIKPHLLSYIYKTIKKGSVSINLTDNLSSENECENETESDSDEELSFNGDTDAKILVAEDVSINLKLTVNMLESLNYTNVDKAINGQEAIEKLDNAFKNSSPYKVLLLDLCMPIKDGFSVIKHIKKYKYDINIAIMTGSVLESDRNRCKKLGVKWFIVKPIEMLQLHNVMKYMTK